MKRFSDCERSIFLSEFQQVFFVKCERMGTVLLFMTYFHIHLLVLVHLPVVFHFIQDLRNGLQKVVSSVNELALSVLSSYSTDRSRIEWGITRMYVCCTPWF